MIIEQTFTVNAPREVTAAFFVDIDQVSACVPGVENVRETENGQYAAILAVKLGPIRAAFEGSIELDEAEIPERLKATGQGRDRSTGSVAKVSFTADLVETEPGQTTVTAIADVALRGRMAQFGTGVMRAAAGELVREFAACANSSLAAKELEESSDGSSDTETESSPPPSVSPGIVGILMRGLLAASIRRIRRLGSNIKTTVANVAGGGR